MKKLFLSLFVCIFCVTFSFAQENSENEIQTKNALGFFIKTPANANHLPLGGINYQRWLNDYLGVQGSIQGTFYSKNQEPNYNFCTDLELQVRFIKHKFKVLPIESTVYAWLSGGLIAQDEVDVYGDGSVDVYKDCSFCTGIGFGVDFVFHEHISVPLAIGYLANIGDTISADFSISTGFRYRF